MRPLAIVSAAIGLVSLGLSVWLLIVVDELSDEVYDLQNEVDSLEAQQGDTEQSVTDLEFEISGLEATAQDLRYDVDDLK
jgi:peptidoglycan hydrolase CwlO-like protein